MARSENATILMQHGRFAKGAGNMLERIPRVPPATLAALFAIATLLVGACAMAVPAMLYYQRAYQSPVHGAADDLLMLSGWGLAADDRVVYQAIIDTTRELSPPVHMPAYATAESGIAALVSVEGLPYSVTIKLPPAVDANRPYALWIRTSRGEWSNAVRINDTRALWFTPAYVYATTRLASLPRELKVVGRNLQSAPGRSTQIRLIGPQDFLGAAIAEPELTATLSQYVARVKLPQSLRPGRYRVQLSRDSVNWAEVLGQVFEVRPDPAPQKEFSVGDLQFGHCRPDDGADDTACVMRAIAAAKLAGRASVYFGPGTWDLIDGAQQGLKGNDGIVVPVGVSLRGAGSGLTRLARHAEWNADAPDAAALTLQGSATVSGFTFTDLKVYDARDHAGPFILLGEHFEHAASASSHSSVESTADGLVVTGNTFDKTMVAVGSGGLPIRRLFITYNVFGAFDSALELGGSQYNMAEKFRIDDSIIAHNVFKPGSKLDPVARTGTLASELGAGLRLDFSGNTADGTSADYLYSQDDAKGWRAAFFWSLTGSVEETLISQNSITCSGDKIGDGEAISLDNNTNTFAFAAAPLVQGAADSSISVSDPLVLRQNGRDVPAAYYVDHWVQIVSGPGLGQVRKIAGYSTDAVTHVTRFSVTPGWDVMPVAGRSRMAVGREYWQVLVVGNHIDNRQPLCQKSNRSRHAAGGITIWAQTADSVIAGNRQYDSDGILVQQNYIIPEHACPDCTMQGFFQSNLHIHSNLVDGEYDWGTDCSASGIILGVAAAPWGNAAPPTVGFGVSISHNTVRHADGLLGGAIGQIDSWTAGPDPHRWPLSESVIIQHNSIVDVDGPRAFPMCGRSHARMGIVFPEHEIAWHTVLYGNSCKNVSQPLGPGGVDTVRLCPSSVADSCECQPPPNGKN